MMVFISYCIIITIQSKLRELKARKEKPITFKEAWKVSKQIGAHKYIECSAMTTENVKELFDEVVKAGLAEPQTNKSKDCAVM